MWEWVCREYTLVIPPIPSSIFSINRGEQTGSGGVRLRLRHMRFSKHNWSRYYLKGRKWRKQARKPPLDTPAAIWRLTGLVNWHHEHIRCQRRCFNRFPLSVSNNEPPGLNSHIKACLPPTPPSLLIKRLNEQESSRSQLTLEILVVFEPSRVNFHPLEILITEAVPSRWFCSFQL